MTASRPKTMPIPTTVDRQAEAEVLHHSPQAGKRPCFLGGFCWTFVRSSSSARMRRGRVSRGSMTSSIWPTSAAR